MQVEDADLLDEFLEEQMVYSSDFQALVLRMVSYQSGSVQQVSQQTGSDRRCGSRIHYI